MIRFAKAFVYSSILCNLVRISWYAKQLIRRLKSEPNPTYNSNSHSTTNEYLAITWQNASIAEFQVTAFYVTVFGIKGATNVLASLWVAKIVRKTSAFVNVIRFPPGFESNVAFCANVQPRLADDSFPILITLSPVHFRVAAVTHQGHAWKRCKTWLIYYRINNSSDGSTV